MPKMSVDKQEVIDREKVHKELLEFFKPVLPVPINLQDLAHRISGADIFYPEFSKALKNQEVLRKCVKNAEEKLEEARILSVKEPLQLSDRLTLNGLIREAQKLLASTKD